jgi:hypothetical protein
MALQDIYWAKVKLGMSNRKSSTHRLRVVPAEGQAYINAITQTLKDGTDVGLYLLSVEDLSAGTLIEKGVELSTEDDAADYPASSAKVWAWDKLSISYHAGFDNYTVTIPGRDNAKYNVGPDGVTVIASGAGSTTETSQYVTRFNAVAVGKNNTAATFDQMYVSQ